MMTNKILGSDRGNSVLIRECFQDVICKAETASRNWEGERHVSELRNGKWTWMGLRKKEVLTAYKAHFVRSG